MADIFNFNYILVSNFAIKDSELSNIYDFSNMISIKFPCLYSEKYHPYIIDYFERNNIKNPDYSYNYSNNSNKNINKNLDIYNLAEFYYITNFANLNNHIFYLGELNEHFGPKSSSLIEDMENLNFEENEKIENYTKNINNNDNNIISQSNVYSQIITKSSSKYKNKFSFKENLDKFLSAQISNHMIHFVDQKQNTYQEKDFSEMDLYEKENLINNNNSKMKIHGMGNFDGVQIENNGTWNFNYNLNYNENLNIHNFSQSKFLMNPSTNFLNSTGENLSEFLSDCQKLILLSGFIASELPQRLDIVIFKAVKKSNINAKVIKIFN